MSRTSRRILWSGTWVLALCLTCSQALASMEKHVHEEQSAEMPATDVPPVALTAEQQAATKELPSQMRGGSFPSSVRTPTNGPAFLWLVANSKDEKVVVSSLQAARQLYVPSTKSAKKLNVNDDYRNVVKYRLRSSSDRILAPAIEASVRSITGAEPDGATVEILADIAATGSTPAKHKALSTVWSTPRWQENERIAKVYLAALDHKEAHLVSQALFRVKRT